MNATDILHDPELHRELCRNEAHCVRDNIVVRVDRISADGRVALCTVEQCLFGMVRRTLSFQELVRRAETALAPLGSIGVTPIVTVLPRATDANVHGADGMAGWPAAMWQWMGHPLARNGYGHLLLVHDPFGWRKASTAAARAARTGPQAGGA